MMPRLTRTFVIVVGLVFASDSSASGTNAALTKHALDTRASAACQTASIANSRVVLAPRPTNAAGWLRDGKSLLAIQRREIKTLQKLLPPASLATVWQTYLDGLHQEENGIEPLFRAYASGDQARINKLDRTDQRLANRDSSYARKLGALGCV
jgi:hypothetical protein